MPYIDPNDSLTWPLDGHDYGQNRPAGLWLVITWDRHETGEPLVVPYTTRRAALDTVSQGLLTETNEFLREAEARQGEAEPHAYTTERLQACVDETWTRDDGSDGRVTWTSEDEVTTLQWVEIEDKR